ncbi:RNase H-like domain-containing protein, partial [Acinetobacter baumannii]
MTTLLGNKVEFKWTQKCQEAFETLKEKLTTAPVLVLPDVH